MQKQYNIICKEKTIINLATGVGIIKKEGFYEYSQQQKKKRIR